MVHVTPALPAEADELARLMAVSFHQDPPLRAMVRAEGEELSRRSYHLFRSCLLSGPLGAGTVDVAREGSEVLVVAIWHGPGASNGIGPYLAQARGFLRAFGARGLAHAARIQAGAEAYHPASEHWYLQALGVRSGAQGGGIGTLLLRHGLERADQQSIPSYLESSTPRTGILYSRMGFHPLRRVEAWPEGAPYGMWRPVP